MPDKPWERIAREVVADDVTSDDLHYWDKDDWALVFKVASRAWEEAYRAGQKAEAALRCPECGSGIRYLSE